MGGEAVPWAWWDVLLSGALMALLLLFVFVMVASALRKRGR